MSESHVEFLTFSKSQDSEIPRKIRLKKVRNKVRRGFKNDVVSWLFDFFLISYARNYPV